jgi:hypothetical protein
MVARRDVREVIPGAGDMVIVAGRLDSSLILLLMGIIDN